MTETLRENGGSWAEELAEAPARQRKSRPSKASNSRGSTPGGTPRSRKAQAAGEGFRHALEAQLRAQQNHAGNSAKASLLHRYQITPNILGEGATGKVKAAVHRETGQKVAIKTFRWNKLCESAKADVLRESGIQCSLDHPKIAKAREMVKTGERLYLVLEMLEGGDVLDRLHEAEHLTERLAMRVVKQVLEAIQYMHSNGMVHRDIKPDNIVFESVDRDQVKLIDFGLCCKWREGSAPMHRVCGTKAYVAPEVLKACYTNKADMWSLGVTVHAMLTGDIIGRGKDGTPVTSKKLRLCSPKVREFIEALLAPDPAARMSASEALGHGWLQDSKKLEGGRPRTCTEGTESTMATNTPIDSIFSQESPIPIGDDVAQGADPSPSDLETHKFQDGTPSRPRKAVGLVRLVRSLWSAVRGKKASVAPEPMESIVPSPSAR